MLYPATSVDVLAVHDRLTECVDTAVPVPVSDSVMLGDWALLVMVSVALALPAACGLNVIVNGRLCPAGIVAGNESPLTVKAELFVTTALTMTLAPVALKLPDAVPLSPTVTLPNARVAGLTDN